MATGSEFLWGAQYYRAPTPDSSCWAADLDRARDLGFTDIKIWSQWRWVQRAPDAFHLEDLLRLADLIHARGMRLTVNTIFDVAPVWVLARYPDAAMVTADGRAVESRANAFRQIGGFPGPCLRHEGPAAERRRFLEATVEALRGHPALSMWDVWNEPEQNFFSREPRPGNYVCYCRRCRDAFIPWLQGRHASLPQLNERWGRCYGSWAEVEAPALPDTLVDWLDWREFQLDGMTDEARWRLDLVRQLDPGHAAYLHVVPNTMDVFNSISGVDDFALAELCPVWAATCNGGPQWMHQLASAGGGKRCYNVESHVNYGSSAMHQRMLGAAELARDLVPQLGQGIAGILFWQFRSESLGTEAPAWGVVHLDGSDRPVTQAIARFGQSMLPHRELLLDALPPSAAIGIWKSRRNEIIHQGIHGNLGSLFESVDGYVQALHWQNLPFRFICERQLERGELSGLSLIIMPSPYCLAAEEAAALDRFLRSGGHVLSEAHLGAWEPERGRHALAVPGQGLAERWALREVETTSSYHLASDQLGPIAGELSDDVRKALRASGAIGGQHFPIEFSDGARGWGCERFAQLSCPQGTVLGRFAGVACMTVQSVGAGMLTYVGTRWGQAARKDVPAFERTLCGIAAQAGIHPVAEVEGRAHVDVRMRAARPAVVAITAASDAGAQVRARIPGRWRGMLTGLSGSLEQGIAVPAGFSDLLIQEQ